MNKTSGVEKLSADGCNEHGVAMCECKPYGPVHAYEPGEWCSPERKVPVSSEDAGTTLTRDGVEVQP